MALVRHVVMKRSSLLSEAKRTCNEAPLPTLNPAPVRHAVPAIYQLREFAAGGGVASYGPNISDAYHLMGSYTGRVLNGAKPADLPVQRSTKVELIINMKAARALGISVPLPLSGRADEVIE